MGTKDENKGNKFKFYNRYTLKNEEEKISLSLDVFEVGGKGRIKDLWEIVRVE